MKLIAVLICTVAALEITALTAQAGQPEQPGGMGYGVTLTSKSEPGAEGSWRSLYRGTNSDEPAMYGGGGNPNINHLTKEGYGGVPTHGK